MILHHQMVSSEKKLANAMGGKTARACDSCIIKRARWYCAADDVFLCQFCDASVHPANTLARGHERVGLKLASLKRSSSEIPPLTWQQGFKKKSRPPRVKSNDKNGSHGMLNFRESRIRFNPLHAVPEIGSDEVNAMNSDEKLSHQVPVFDRFPGELYFSGDFDDRAAVPIEEKETTNLRDTDESEVPFHLNYLNGLILQSDFEPAEFTADVESLFDEQSFDIDAPGRSVCRLNDSERVKVEEKIQMSEPFPLSLDYDSPVAWEEEDEIVAVENGENQIGLVKDEDENVNVLTEIYNTKKHTKMLKINYEGIIAAWDDDRSPWMTGCRPELDPTDFWPDCMGGGEEDYQCGDPGKPSRLDGGREARVSRYREKRRTRLFSKKIRYEVRKLNAEKRPRMKGRFVKRPSFLAATSGFSLRCK